MATSLMQKLRLAWRGWRRRQEEKERGFVNKNAGWGPPPHPSPLPGGEGEAATTRRGPLPLGEGGQRPGEGAPRRIDLEGLQIAYLDDSGRIDYYLDTD